MIYTANQIHVLSLYNVHHTSYDEHYTAYAIQNKHVVNIHCGLIEYTQLIQWPSDDTLVPQPVPITTSHNPTILQVK